MTENEKMKRCQGQHCKRNEVKTEILMYILKADGAISESEIRRHLFKQFGIRNSRNIKDHLKKLKEMGCIEKFELVGDDSGNEWDITKLENLRKIDEHFHAIPQNEYSKCLSLLPLEEISICLNCLKTETLRFHAKMSRTFFDMCLKNDFKKAFSQTKVYFRFTEEGHEAEQHLNKRINDFYEKYIEKNIVAPETEFKRYNSKKVLKNRLLIWNEKPELEMNNQLNDNFCILHFPKKMLDSSTSKMLEENSTIKKDTSVEVLKETSDEISESIFKALLENQSEELYNDIREIKTFQKINCISSYYLFFKSCVLQDFQNSRESFSEMYFLRYLEKSLATLPTIIGKKDSMDLFTRWHSFIKEHDNIYSSFYKSDFDHEN